MPENPTSSGESATDLRDALNSEPSRVFRQVVAIEIFWVVGAGESAFRDWESEVRSAVMDSNDPGYPAQGEVSEVEELFPRPETPGG